MATSAEPKLAKPPRLLPLCLDCNYSLRGLAQSRCPECGREFNIQDPTSFNNERPLRWIDRQLMKPIGWPMFSMTALLCCGCLYFALYPAIYYGPVFIMLAFLLVVAVSLMLIVRRALRDFIPPKSVPRCDMKRRERVVIAIFALTVLLILFHVPLRIVFFLAQPELDRLAKGIMDGSIQLPITSHRAGPITVSSSQWYGDNDQYFFLNHQFGGGFAYCRTPGRPLYYNSGADGHLWGNWYWWIDD